MEAAEAAEAAEAVEAVEVPRAHIHTFVFNRPVLPGTDNGGGVG